MPTKTIVIRIESHNQTHLNRVVQNFGGRMKHQILQGRDFWLLPTAQAPVVVHLHHVVGEELAKAHLISLGFGLQLIRSGQSH